MRRFLFWVATVNLFATLALLALDVIWHAF